MIQFFRKIRQQLLIENKTYKYLKYAIGEIILVVIGILIALQINNWNENKKLEKAEKQYYANIKRQLIEDINFIRNNIDYNNRHYKQYQFAIDQIQNNDRSHIDSLAVVTINLLEYSDFHQESNIYGALVNSGEIKLLRNKNIVEGLQKLEELYIYMNRLENTHFDLIKIIYPELKKIIRFKPLKVEKAEELFKFEFQNHFVLVSELSMEKDEIYNRALNEIAGILNVIDNKSNIEEN